MIWYCKMTVDLHIRAPFLCAAAGVSNWGVNAAFYRDHQNRPAIPASHVKGKLREAWRELNEAGALTVDTVKRLGREAGEKDCLAHRGDLLFTDFVFTGQESSSGERNRISIDRESGTAREGAIFTIETPFASGEETVWRGEIEFTAVDGEAVDGTANHILQGLRWITALGAEKGVGFGRLLKVELIDKASVECRAAPGDPVGDSESLGLRLTARDPLLAGGVRIKDNYLESRQVLSGSVIKGALAQCLRRRLGLGANEAIRPRLDDLFKKAGLDVLAEHFEGLRIAHAFPSKTPDRRPVVPPLTLVRGGRLFDVALGKDPVLGDDGRAPAFSVDWKDRRDVDAAFGWRRPGTMVRTKTAIDAVSRTAKEEKLYTYEYILPTDQDGHEVYWLGNIYFPDGLEESVRRCLKAQLCFVLENWFDRVGKKNGRLGTISCTDRAWPAVLASGETIKDGLTVVTLQTDALMLNPWGLKDGGREELFKSYSEIWSEFSNDAYELKDFFAAQSLAGGYLGRRFRVNELYYPFLLTRRGSVFVLEVRDGREGEAEKQCRVWLLQGLPPPSWALEKYGRSTSLGENELHWKKCPFTRQNGYGEAAVNLSWHWEKARGALCQKQDG